MKIIPISGHIGFDVWPEDVRRELNAAAGEDVELHISSGGGFISDGLEIFNLIYDYPGKTTARIIGMAASMASYIPLAADKVIAKSNAVFMIHGALMGIYGNEDKHRETADVLGGLTNLLADIYIKKTGKPEAEIKALLKKDSYFFGSEMLDAGFVDEIEEIEVPTTPEDKANLLLSAKADIKLCVDKVLSSVENGTKAAAYLALNKIPTDPPKPAKKPANSNQNTGNPMNEALFLAFLESNPEAKSFYLDGMTYIKAVADQSAPQDLSAMSLPDVLELAPVAKTEHETVVVEAGKAVEAGKMSELETKFLVAAISSGKYGASVVECIADSFNGKASYMESKRMIAGADETAAQIAAAKLIDGQPEETPAGGVNAGDDTSVKSPKIQASIKNFKSLLGV